MIGQPFAGLVFKQRSEAIFGGTYSINLAFLFLLALAKPLAADAAQPSPSAWSRLSYEPILTRGFTPIEIVSTKNLPSYVLPVKDKTKAIESFCKRVAVHFKKFRWDKNPCGSVDWQARFQTGSKHPLVYATFGAGDHTTLILGGVHPDEYTPIPIAFRFATKLQGMSAMLAEKGIRVVIAPLVNPDGFIRSHPTRANGNGVDVNRNFFTMDWYDRAKKWWVDGKRRDKRHFPGYFPHSEIETAFQVALIDTFVPDKIITIHAPLGFLDYDGPGDGKARLLSSTERKAKRLAEAISEKSENYRIVDYSFYPGSLGNFAGNERGIPTITLELMTTDPAKLEHHWRQFYPGLMQSIKYPFKKSDSIPSSPNATKFSRYSLARFLKDGALPTN